MVVIYSDFLLLNGPFAETEQTPEEYFAQERLWQMCERHIDDLRQHRFIETTSYSRPIPEEIQYLHEQLGILRLHMPFAFTCPSLWTSSSRDSMKQLLSSSRLRSPGAAQSGETQVDSAYTKSILSHRFFTLL
jgi:hypothetical protein